MTDEQVTKIANKIRSFGDQEYKVTTFWDLKEPLAISHRIHQALTLAAWKYIPVGPGGAFLLGGIAGVQVWVHPEADQRVREAAETLVRALNDEDITAELRQQNHPAHLGDQRCQPRPLRIPQIARITAALAPIDPTVLVRPHRRSPSR